MKIRETRLLLYHVVGRLVGSWELANAPFGRPPTESENMDTIGTVPVHERNIKFVVLCALPGIDKCKTTEEQRKRCFVVLCVLIVFQLDKKELGASSGTQNEQTGSCWTTRPSTQRYMFEQPTAGQCPRKARTVCPRI